MANPWLKKNPLMSMWLSAVLAAARTRGWTARVRFDGLSALMRPARRAGASRTGPEPRETVRHAAALAPASQPRPAPPGRALPAAHEMHVLSSVSVIERAEQIVRMIVDTYLGPNRSFPELRAMVSSRSLDPLREFSEACRTELQPAYPDRF